LPSMAGILPRAVFGVKIPPYRLCDQNQHGVNFRSHNDFSNFRYFFRSRR
jgi:hypothetical protein